MATRLDVVVGENSADNLFYENTPDADVVIVTVTDASAKRGAVLTGTAGGDMAVATAALSADNACYILADDISEAGEAQAYKSGHFVKQTIDEAGGYELTAADIEVLRAQNIIVDEAAD